MKRAISAAVVVVFIFVSVPAQAKQLVCDLSQRTFIMCDNFGKVWTLELDKGEIRGVRDMTDPGLQCGELPVYGTICCPQNKVRLTVLDTPEDGCMSTFWEGRFTTPALDVIEGEVWNENGFFGTFILYECDGVSGGGASDPDPAR
ncbi:MAG: hypothetical protein JSV16_09345 [Candidatus Hydrogenedentota bacterium]|nr:MAG: hypothetical protein JSV16_09345 [Candidatus Hydrogenedentota bacterium]